MEPMPLHLVDRILKRGRSGTSSLRLASWCYKCLRHPAIIAWPEAAVRYFAGIIFDGLIIIVQKATESHYGLHISDFFLSGAVSVTNSQWNQVANLLRSKIQLQL